MTGRILTRKKPENWKDNTSEFKKFNEQRTLSWINEGFEKEEARSWLKKGVTIPEIISYYAWKKGKQKEELTRLNLTDLLRSDKFNKGYRSWIGKFDYCQNDYCQKRFKKDLKFCLDCKKDDKNEEFLKKERDKRVTSLEIPGEIFEKKLEGILDLTSFSNLRILDCSHNKLTSIILPDNNKLVLFFCGDNLLESLEIPRNNKIEHFDAEDNNIKSIESFKNLNPETLTWFFIKNNNISETDINFFLKFKKLKYLSIGNQDRSKEEKGIRNRFVGSFENWPETLPNLKYLVIDNIEIYEDLTELSEKLAHFSQETELNLLKEKIELQKQQLSLEETIIERDQRVERLENRIKQLENTNKALNKLLNEKNEIIDGKIAWKKLEISQQRMSSGQTIMEDSDERERVGLIQQTEDRIIFQKRRRIDW